MVIATTDFLNRPYKVPNQPESPDFEIFIEQAEEDLAIRYLLGYDLWNEFQDALDQSGALDAKWSALKDGITYTYGGKNYHYNGWVDMVRPAIYSQWQPEGTWKFTNVGWVNNNANSAPQAGNQSQVIEDPYPFMVKYWNEFVLKVGFQHSLGYNYMHSFYGFMKANESDYDDWVFNCPQFKNRHDI